MAAASPVSHPLFARFYARFAAQLENKGAAEHRQEALAGLRGRVVELGAGTGLNFGHYPVEVTEVMAVEPEPYLRDHARSAASGAPVTIKIVDGLADAIPADDASFDAGVASLVLCSVPNQGSALAELLRVIKPGGELRFYEHVRATNERWAHRQDRLDRIWPALGGGCHCNRDTVAAISSAGFEIENSRRFLFQPCWVSAPVAPIALGVARRPEMLRGVSTR